MQRLIVFLGICILPGMVCAQTRTPNQQPVDDKGTYLGILFAPVPTADNTLPTPAPGVQVTHVLPDSPAARAGLRRNDVLLEYAGQKLRSCDHFAGLIRDDKPERKVKLVLLRDGQSITTEATLALGPAILLPGEAKTTPTGPITVGAKPLPDGKMRVTVEYLGATGKAQSLVCEGSTGAINDALRQLPDRERGFVLAALESIRKLNTEKPQDKPDDKKR